MEPAQGGDPRRRRCARREDEIDVGPLRALWTAEGSAGMFLAVDTIWKVRAILSSPREALETWKLNRSLAAQPDAYEGYVEDPPRDPRITAGWYSAGWMPFADWGGGHLTLYYDTAPGPGGKRGQIIATSRSSKTCTQGPDGRNS